MFRKKMEMTTLYMTTEQTSSTDVILLKAKATKWTLGRNSQKQFFYAKFKN